MQKTTLLHTLSTLGLSEKEAEIYLTSLSLGSSSILQIARTCGIKRTTIYSLVESLRQKGLLTIEIRGFKQYFVAEHPEKLEFLLEEKRQKLNQTLPELTALYNLKGNEGIIKYYEGIPAIKSIYENLLKEMRPHEDYLVMSKPDDWIKWDKEFFLNFLFRRGEIARGIDVRIRSLLQKTPRSEIMQKEQSAYFQTVKLLPPKTNLSTNLVILPKKVVIHQLHPPIIAIVIENPSIIQMHREMFEIMWESIS